MISQQRLILLGALALVALIPGYAHALKAGHVEFGSGGSYEDPAIVIIDRVTSGGNAVMTFADEETTPPISLANLVGGGVAGGDHGQLTGLADDDHSQYKNTARHSSTHDATFNNAMAITGDPEGNVTVGTHVADQDTHFRLSPGVFNVYADGTGPYATLQAAADAAESAGAGSIVLAWPGIYSQTLALASDISLLGLTVDSFATQIIASVAGGPVVSSAGGVRFITGCFIQNSNSSDLQSPALELSNGGLVSILGCTLVSGGWGAVSETGNATIVIRRSFVTAIHSVLYMEGAGDLRDSTFSTGGGSSANPIVVGNSAVGLWRVVSCSMFGNSNTVGAFRMNAAGSTILMQTVHLSGGAETQLFHENTAAVTINATNVNAEAIGGKGNITIAELGKLGERFTTDVTFEDSGALAATKWRRVTGGSGNYLTIHDENSTLKAYVNTEGQWWPPPGDSEQTLMFTAVGSIVTTATRDQSLDSTGFPSFTIEFDNVTTGAGFWSFPNASDIEARFTTGALSVQIFYVDDTGSDGAVAWQLGTSGVTSDSVLLQTMTWSADLVTTPVATAGRLSISPVFTVEPIGWEASAELRVGLRRVIADDATGTIEFRHVVVTFVKGVD